MSEEFPKPIEKIPRRFENIDEAVKRVKELADSIRAKTNKAIVIDVVGLPHSGKTFFIKEFLDRYNTVKYTDTGVIGAGYTTTNYDREEEWKKGLESDYFLIQDVGGWANFFAEEFGTQIDLRIFIYDPKESSPTIQPNFFDIIISNDQANKANKI